MTRIVGGMVALGVAALLVGPLTGADEKKPEKKPADPYAGMFSFPKKITLDDKQKDKLAALKTEYSPKLAALDKQRDAVLTPERIKAAKEAQKKALDAGTKDKKELNKIYNETLKVTKDEQKQLAEINKARGALNKEINEKKTALLTDAQKEALKAKPKPKPTEKPKDK